MLAAFGALGVSYMFLLPPFQVPDERRHWVAAHHHMAKFVTGSGTFCSTDVALDRHFDVGVKLNPQAKFPGGIFSRVVELRPECEETHGYGRSNITTYPGVVLSRVFLPREPTSGVQSLVGFYVSRLLHGTLIGLLLLRLWWLARNDATGPPGLLALLLLALSPLFIQQSFGITNDVVTNAFALAICTWLIFSDRQNRIDEAVLVLLGAVAAFTKPVLSIPLLPLVALGLCLNGLRQAPGEPWFRSFTQTLIRKRVLVGALVGVSASGFFYGRSNLRLGKRAPQLEFIAENPGYTFDVIMTRISGIFSSPSIFIDDLGYLDTRLSNATLASFGLLVALVAALEMILLYRGGRRLVKDPILLKQRSADLWPVAALASTVLASLLFGIFMIGFVSYLISPLGSDRLYGMQARYLFPHLMLGTGVAMAIARIFLAPSRSSPETPGDGPTPEGRVVNVAVLAVFGLALVSLGFNLGTDILARYY